LWEWEKDKISSCDASQNYVTPHKNGIIFENELLSTKSKQMVAYAC
jgi:hypothetical protein